MNTFGILYIVFGLIYIILCVLDTPEVKANIRKYVANKFNLYEDQYMFPKYPTPYIETPYIEITYPKIEKIACQHVICERDLYEFSIMYDNGVNVLIENVKEIIARNILEELKKHNFIKYEIDDNYIDFDYMRTGKRVYGELYVKT